MKKETIGKVATDLMAQQTHEVSAIEQMRESLSDYEKNVWECVDRCKKEFPGDFYIVVITKNEKLLPNVLRNFFYGRLSCPTPDYDQTVYKYKRKDNQVIFMWVIPSRTASFHLKEHALEVDRQERELLKFVMAFDDGTLFKLAKELNGEVDIDTPFVEGGAYGK